MHKAAKELYFEILSLSPNNPYVEATVGLFYGIPEKYKALGLGDSAYDKALKKSTTLQPYLMKY